MLRFYVTAVLTCSVFLDIQPRRPYLSALPIDLANNGTWSSKFEQLYFSGMLVMPNITMLAVEVVTPNLLPYTPAFLSPKIKTLSMFLECSQVASLWLGQSLLESLLIKTPKLEHLVLSRGYGQAVPAEERWIKSFSTRDMWTSRIILWISQRLFCFSLRHGHLFAFVSNLPGPFLSKKSQNCLRS